MRTAIVFGAVATGISCAAMGNGINPPRPREALAMVTTATCTPRAAGRSVELLRANVTGGEKDGELLAWFDDVRTSIDIDRAISVEMPKSGIDRQGTAAGRVTFKTGEVRKGRIVVRTPEGKVRLVGFDRNRSRIELDLVACRKVAFSATVASDSSRIDAPKK